MNQLPKISNQLSNEEYNGSKHTPKQKTDEKTFKLLVSAEQEVKVSAMMSPHIISLNQDPTMFNTTSAPEFQPSFDYHDKSVAASSVKTGIVKNREMETISEDLGSEALDKIETITSPQTMFGQSNSHITPKHHSGMQ